MASAIVGSHQDMPAPDHRKDLENQELCLKDDEVDVSHL